MRQAPPNEQAQQVGEKQDDSRMSNLFTSVSVGVTRQIGLLAVCVK